MKRLRVPMVLAFVVAGGGATVVGVEVGCSDGPPPTIDASAIDASAIDASASAIDASEPCLMYCVPISEMEGNACRPPICVDSNGMCPTGCQPEPVV